MTLHFNTVTPILSDYLHRLMHCESLASFYLAGGTALALQLGHRISIDIDLFTNLIYGKMNLSHIVKDLQYNFSVCEGIDCLKNQQMVYTVYVGDSRETLVKLDLCYDEEPIYPIQNIDGIRIVSDKDIAAMKLLAIVTGNRLKDFWDIYELKHKYELRTMIDWALQRNPYTLTAHEILAAFNKVWDFPEPDDIISLKEYKWPFIADKLFADTRKIAESGEFD